MHGYATQEKRQRRRRQATTSSVRSVYAVYTLCFGLIVPSLCYALVTPHAQGLDDIQSAILFRVQNGPFTGYFRFVGCFEYKARTDINNHLLHFAN